MPKIFDEVKENERNNLLDVLFSLVDPDKYADLLAGNITAFDANARTNLIKELLNKNPDGLDDLVDALGKGKFSSGITRPTAPEAGQANGDLNYQLKSEIVAKERRDNIQVSKTLLDVFGEAFPEKKKKIDAAKKNLDALGVQPAERIVEDRLRDFKKDFKRDFKRDFGDIRGTAAKLSNDLQALSGGWRRSETFRNMKSALEAVSALNADSKTGDIVRALYDMNTAAQEYLGAHEGDRRTAKGRSRKNIAEQICSLVDRYSEYLDMDALEDFGDLTFDGALKKVRNNNDLDQQRLNETKKALKESADAWKARKEAKSKEAKRKAEERDREEIQDLKGHDRDDVVYGKKDLEERPQRDKEIRKAEEELRREDEEIERLKDAIGRTKEELRNEDETLKGDEDKLRSVQDEIVTNEAESLKAGENIRKTDEEIRKTAEEAKRKAEEEAKRKAEERAREEIQDYLKRHDRDDAVYGKKDLEERRQRDLEEEIRKAEEELQQADEEIKSLKEEIGRTQKELRDAEETIKGDEDKLRSVQDKIGRNEAESLKAGENIRKADEEIRKTAEERDRRRFQKMLKDHPRYEVPDGRQDLSERQKREQNYRNALKRLRQYKEYSDFAEIPDKKTQKLGLCREDYEATVHTLLDYQRENAEKLSGRDMHPDPKTVSKMINLVSPEKMFELSKKPAGHALLNEALDNKKYQTHYMEFLMNEPDACRPWNSLSREKHIELSEGFDIALRSTILDIKEKLHNSTSPEDIRANTQDLVDVLAVRISQARRSGEFHEREREKDRVVDAPEDKNPQAQTVSDRSMRDLYLMGHTVRQSVRQEKDVNIRKTHHTVPLKDHIMGTKSFQDMVNGEAAKGVDGLCRLADLAASGDILKLHDHADKFRSVNEFYEPYKEPAPFNKETDGKLKVSVMTDGGNIDLTFDTRHLYAHAGKVDEAEKSNKMRIAYMEHEIQKSEKAIEESKKELECFRGMDFKEMDQDEKAEYKNSILRLVDNHNKTDMYRKNIDVLKSGKGEVDFTVPDLAEQKFQKGFASLLMHETPDTIADLASAQGGMIFGRTPHGEKLIDELNGHIKTVNTDITAGLTNENFGSLPPGEKESQISQLRENTRKDLKKLLVELKAMQRDQRNSSNPVHAALKQEAVTDMLVIHAIDNRSVRDPFRQQGASLSDIKNGIVQETLAACQCNTVNDLIPDENLPSSIKEYTKTLQGQINKVQGIRMAEKLTEKSKSGPEMH